MLKIGITGGIGSGKTTVCKVWQSLGAYIINADELAKKVMQNDEEVKRAIINTFGSASYHPDGSLNRRHLADEAFKKGRVQELNAIVHPGIPAKVTKLMKEAEQQGTEASVYEAALLLQDLRPENLDHVVLVLADEQQRVQWVQKRDEVNRKGVMDRIGKQQNFRELTPLADFLIENDGSLNELKKKAKALYQKIVTAKTD